MFLHSDLIFTFSNTNVRIYKGLRTIVSPNCLLKISFYFYRFTILFQFHFLAINYSYLMFPARLVS